MLNENMKTIRKSKGLSQEELAIKLNVVRQTISKWEQGLSVPDADMLITLSEALETPVSVLLGETVAPAEEDGLQAVAGKLEVLNLHSHRGGFRGPHRAQEPLLGLGLQPPRNRGNRCGVPRA